LTKKEALLKAVGSGLTKPMNEFSVSGSEDETMKFNIIHPGLKNNGWFVKNFHLSGTTVGALATNGKVKSINYINMNAFNQ
jgi:phosphopantetheinyl transferase